MRHEQYTDDVICQAMGLGAFVPVDLGRAIRLLLKPSFHPEVCVTLEATHIQTVALQTMLWREPFPHRMQEYAETSTITEDQFALTVDAFNRAQAEFLKRPRSVSVDGMPVSALLIDGDRQECFAGQPFGSEHAKFVSDLLLFAHTCCSSIRLRNRIAQCGQYIDGRLSVEPELPEPEMTRLLVLGEPAERAAYLDILRHKKPPPK